MCVRSYGTRRRVHSTWHWRYFIAKDQHTKQTFSFIENHKRIFFESYEGHMEYWCSALIIFTSTIHFFFFWDTRITFEMVKSIFFRSARIETSVRGSIILRRNGQLPHLHVDVVKRARPNTHTHKDVQKPTRQCHMRVSRVSSQTLYTVDARPEKPHRQTVSQISHGSTQTFAWKFDRQRNNARKLWEKNICVDSRAAYVATAAARQQQHHQHVFKQASSCTVRQ